MVRMTLHRRSLTAAVLATAAALVAVLTGCAAPAAQPDATAGGDAPVELRVFAAASLAGVMDELTAAYTAEHPNVTFAPVVSDGSPALVAQVLDGAPVDVVALASEAAWKPLTEAEDGAAPAPIPFASNELRIAVPTGNPLGLSTLVDLAKPGLRVALCAPEVPCGTASAKLLELAGVAIAGASLETSVTAVGTRVTEGEADAGLVYATDVAASNGALEGIAPEHASEVRTRPSVAALSDAAAATDFAAFLSSPAAQATLARWGFGAP